MAAIEIADPLEFDLTPESFRSIAPKLQPLIAGDDFALRMQVLDRYGSPIALTGWRAFVSFMQNEDDDTPLFTRDHTTEIRSGVTGLAHDTNQSTTVLDADGEPTGIGWATLTCLGIEDEAALLLVRGRVRFWDWRIQLPDLKPVTFARGRCKIMRALTPNSRLIGS